MNFVNFPKISGLCQTHTLPWNLLEKLGEVFKNNFLTAMQDLKQELRKTGATQFLNGVFFFFFFFFFFFLDITTRAKRSTLSQQTDVH